MKNRIDKSQHAFWLAVMPAMVLPLVASLFYFVWFSAEVWARWIYSGTKVFTLVWPLLVWVCLWQRPWPQPEWLSSRHLRALPLGFVTGALMVGTFLLLLQTPVGDVVNASADRMKTKAESLGFLKYYWVFGVFLAVIHSGIEEYYWRWFVCGRLRERLPAWSAYLLGALAFAAHHIVVTTQFFPLVWGVLFGLSVGVGGAVWHWQMERQGTLAGAWFSHMLVDFGLLAVGHKLIFGSWV